MCFEQLVIFKEKYLIVPFVAAIYTCHYLESYYSY